ncbi:hypothetical protein EB796_024425 [Bugula neritina]|uniref:Uncharacterized protein n=1 Tax=Bugula neritina TaxID=10212 RepID=A0A7J7IV26_BUGNE|nr:hypothetical protein EB796_024425 [Bugula neritina]
MCSQKYVVFCTTVFRIFKLDIGNKDVLAMAIILNNKTILKLECYQESLAEQKAASSKRLFLSSLCVFSNAKIVSNHE